MSVSTALIPYTKPMTPTEFIKSEIDKGLSNGSIKPLIPPQMFHSPLSNLISKIFKARSPQSDLPLLIRRSKPISSCLSRASSPSTKINVEEIFETLQGEVSFTRATDKKPIVATYGCSSCIALGGYDQNNKMAFIAHFSDKEQFKKSGSLLFRNIGHLVEETITTPIQLHLRGGIKGESEPIIEAIKIWMKQRKDLPMEIASTDILENSTCRPNKSLLIDSRNGFVSEYNPQENSKNREIRNLDVLKIQNQIFSKTITIAYHPKPIEKD